MSTERFLLILPLEFPEGVAPGAGSGYNQLQLARNGRGQPILRGTSLGGVLRHALRRRGTIANISELFGEAAETSDEGTPSRLKISDCVLSIGTSTNTQIRTHHLRDRHTKTVVPQGLFTVESCPPGTFTVARIWLDGSGIDGLQALQHIVEVFRAGVCFGGSSARGIGRAVLKEHAKFKLFNLENLEEHAAYLDMARNMNAPSAPSDFHEFGEIVTADNEAATLQVKLSLRIPRGQDILVADGRGTDYKLQPQWTRSADGTEQWRIPGSSLRGSLRTWMTKVAAKAGHAVADNYDRRKRFNKTGDAYDAPTGENLGRAFLSAEQRKNLEQHPEHFTEIECPIARLFGSLYQAGRITVSDALVRKQGSGVTEQARMHVAVDRITGGAAESMLFDNTVLVADRTDASTFEFHLSIREPRADEVQWLRSALIALDIGLLRLGSSKSSGRLELAKPPEATGPHAEQLVSLVPNHARRK